MDLKILWTPEVQLLVKLLLVAVFGGVIGFEREYFGKAAGLRTHCLVAVASCLFMEVSTGIFELYKTQVLVDPSRIAAQVVSGIGFLGAGAILRSGVSVKGLTTAASLWAVAAIGLACGVGLYVAAICTTAIVVIILCLFSKLEARITKRVE